MPRRLARAAIGLVLTVTAFAGAGSTAHAAPADCTLPSYPPERVVSLAQGQQLASGASLSTWTNDVKLIMQSDGNLVLYLVNSQGGHGPVLWSSDTWGHPGAYASMQTDGNFVVYPAGGPAAGGALWASGTWYPADRDDYLMLRPDGTLKVASATAGAGSWTANNFEFPGVLCAVTAGTPPPWRSFTTGNWAQSGSSWLILQGDGNLVLYRKSDGAPIWSTRTWGQGPDALVMQEDGNLVLYRITLTGQFGAALWSSGTWGHPGAYAQLQDDANFVVYGPDGGPTTGGALWSSQTSGKG